MTDAPRSRYADWKAPAEDGQLLIWPAPDAMRAHARENAATLTAAATPVQGIPLSEVRRAGRAFIRPDAHGPIVATGHQTELYHPGVWAKNILIDRLAAQLGGAAVHFAVDTDSPKHLHLRWPGGSRPITDDPRVNTVDVCAWVSPATPHHLQSVQQDVSEAAASWDFEPFVDPFFSALRRGALEGFTRNIPEAISNAIHAVDWDLGLRYFEFVTSPLWTSEPYLLFVHHVLARADEFASHYNAALAEYRRVNGIRTTARPMPDLFADEGEREAPFWVDHHATLSRARAFVKRDGDAWTLRAATGDQFRFEPGLEGWESARRLQSWCRRNDLWLAPRALTLTLFFRLFLADQFIHGIGGGRYDQVTDDLIRRFFRIEPPHFAVTTATLYFPAAAGQRRVNLYPLLQEGRRIRHGLLSRDKRQLVEQIEAAPRRSRQRQDLFFAMHERLAAESNSPAVRQWEQRFRDAEHESLRQKVLFDRELFFAIQPKQRLLELIQRYHSAV